MNRVPIRYARSGDVNVAYQVTGDGPIDVVLVHGFFSHLEVDWQHPALGTSSSAWARSARLIRFDKRGTGLSDRSVGMPDFETRMDDVRAVMDAAGSERAVLFGYSEGGPMAILFAATYPDERGRSPSTGRMPSASTPRTIPGRRPGRSGLPTPKTSSATGERSSTSV